MIINSLSEVDSDSANDGTFMLGVVEGFYGRPWTTDQRKKLFQRMNRMGMGTYLYAPKDDCKHRMYWRDLYTVEEADHLTALITAADEQNVTFVYALSPGLDMTYSSAKEVTCLKRKLEQVTNFGCRAFALLFDDIDIDMCESDKELFQSFAQAQVSVTNEVFQHLGQPCIFLFCPTEYCASRAVPDVPTSGYLNTIGSKLLSGIDIMWTGPKVISKKISIKSIQEISKVIQRPPVIWDNIHANDYDQRRLFLGPYEGRSSELIPYIRGVMTNPNCEFEANFIAMHTTSHWSKSNVGGLKKDFILSESPVSADIKLETEGEFTTDEDIPVNSTSAYQPKLALCEAVKDWVLEFYNECSPGIRKMTIVPPPITMPILPDITEVDPLTQLSAVLQNNINEGVDVSYMQPSTVVAVNSLVDPSSESEEESGIDSLPYEPMDCAASTSGASTCSSTLTTDAIESVDSIIAEESSSSSTISVGSECNPCSKQTTCSNMNMTETMQVDNDNSEPGFKNHQIMPSSPVPIVPNCIPPCSTALHSHPAISKDSSEMCSVCDEGYSIRMTEQDVHALVQLFYMPFEHGTIGAHLLNEFHWLKVSAYRVNTAKKMNATPEQHCEGQEWHLRSEDFCKKIEDLSSVCFKFCNIPNKALLYDLFPYIWDMTVVMTQVYAFISWLALGHVPNKGSMVLQGSPYSWSSINFQEHFSSGTQEPWVFRGGLQAEFQRMLPLEGAADLLLLPCPSVPVLKLHKVRPYTCNDESAVYAVCRRTCDDGVDGTDIFPDQPDLIGDKLVGAFLNTSPEYCFVIEDEGGVFGYVLAAANADDFHKKVQMAWLPAMQKKYPGPTKEDDLSPAEEIIASFHNHQSFLSQSLFKRHPAVVRMDVIPDRIQDPTIAKRAMVTAVAALKISGANGIHAEIHVGDRTTAEFYSKLGFIDVPVPDMPDDILYIGRTI